MNRANTGDIVLVPVPTDALAAVYRVLADALGGPRPASAIDASDASKDSSSKDSWWTDGRLGILRAELMRFPAVEAIMRLTSRQPGNPVSIKEVEKLSALPQRQIAAQLAALTKFCKSKFGRAEWPFEAKYIPGDTRASYVMVPELSKRWRLLTDVGAPEITTSRADYGLGRQAGK